MENKTKKTKTFTFGMAWQCYAKQSVEVPENFTYKQAKQYVQEHWSEIKLPNNGEYVENSDEPDFENSHFIYFDKEEE